MSPSLLLAFILAISAPVIFAQDNTPEKAISGKYMTGFEFGLTELILKPDRSFAQHERPDDGTEAITSGTFQVADGKVLFVISKSILRGRPGGDLDLLDPKDRKIAGETGTIVKEFSMVPIRWSDRMYLIPESDMKRFADAVNMGIEPRNSLRTNMSLWMGSFYLRPGDENKKATGHPPLPQPWLDLLLKAPVTATVTKIDKTEKIDEWYTLFTATIDRGRIDGLWPGMKLVIPGQGEAWDGPEVISVKQRTAQIKVKIYKRQLEIGDVVTSRYSVQ
jgi:hypothetical protein